MLESFMAADGFVLVRRQKLGKRISVAEIAVEVE
jgi:hypothetical protein